MADCPSENALIEFAEGTLGAVAAASMHAHLDDCPDCRRTVAALAEPATTPAPASLPAVDADRYEGLTEFARGGLGRVLSAHDRKLGRRVAIKELLPGGAGRARFVREALITARLQHPAIVPVHDLGQWPDGEPFFAMKLVLGRPLSEVLAATRSLDERLALLPHALAVADAVAYAHGEGIVHRDLKPANVLVGAFGETVVIDWGLARDLSERIAEPDARAAPSNDPALTLDGSVLGTACYMPPEQARGEAVDRRADVYALGAMLYHLLAGAPPYGRAPSSDQLLADVRSRPPERLELVQPGVPRDLLALVGKAMARDPADRYPSARELGDDLRRFQTGQLVGAYVYSRRALLRRWLARNRRPVTVAAALSTLLVATAAVSVQRILHERHAARRLIDEDVARELAAASASIDEARARQGVLDGVRAAAFAAYDAGRTEEGEAGWERSLAAARNTDASWQHASTALSRALARDGGRREVRAAYAEVLFERALLADRMNRAEARDDLVTRFAEYDDGGALQRRWVAPAHLALTATPAAQVTAARYENEGGRRRLSPARSLGATPLDATLAPGSWLLVVEAPGRPAVRYPILLERSERRRAEVALPERVPEGYVFVPPGRFLYGSADEEEALRHLLLEAEPLHAVETGGYLIGRTEVTFADWIAYLDALPADERERRRPHFEAAHSTFSGQATLELAGGPGAWRLSIHPTTRTYSAREGEPIRYLERTTRAAQNWRRFPVAGVAFVDSRAYAAWLDRTGRLPGARLCDEREWERAARGADERLYPHGDRLAPDDANFDATYGRLPLAFGPDEAGAHPASDSPFGVADLAGQVWEQTYARTSVEEVVLRGGSWYQDPLTARSSNRQPSEPASRSSLIGLRVCASWPAPAR